jgi:hypothetical protein
MMCLTPELWSKACTYIGQSDGVLLKSDAQGDKRILLFSLSETELSFYL